MKLILDYDAFINEAKGNADVTLIENKERLMHIISNGNFKLFREEIEKEEHRLDLSTYNYFGYFENGKCKALVSILNDHYTLNKKGTMNYVYLDCIESKSKGCGKKLFEKVENKLKRYGYRGVILMPINTDIVPYYISLGFEQVTIDGILYMKKKITKYN